MSIPFIRGLPNGQRVLNEIARPDKIERKARKFIAMGGCYLIESVIDGEGDLKVNLIAIIDVAGTAKDVARQTSENGPPLLAAVDALVTESVLHIPPEAVANLLVPAQHAPGGVQ